MRLCMPIVVFLLLGCATQRLEKEQAEWLRAFGSQAPPGTIALNDSLYYDRTEITNLSWLEYEYWVMITFGTGSPEHVAVLPDTSGWDRFPVYGEPYRSSYLRHPAYRDYPVVGVSWEQVIAYSKWRSDRVMEYGLFRAGIIPFLKHQTAKDYFCIERFYATDSLKAFHHLSYPSYDLPELSEWRLAVAVSDSLAKTNLRRCRQRRWHDNPGGAKDDHFIISSRENSAGQVDPIAKAKALYCERGLIWQIRGNVAELCEDSTLVLGGGWTDPLDSILLDQPFPNRAPNVATGFRNVCQWRKWDGAR